MIISIHVSLQKKTIKQIDYLQIMKLVWLSVLIFVMSCLVSQVEMKRAKDKWKIDNVRNILFSIVCHPDSGNSYRGTQSENDETFGQKFVFP